MDYKGWNLWHFSIGWTSIPPAPQQVQDRKWKSYPATSLPHFPRRSPQLGMPSVPPSLTTTQWRPRRQKPFSLLQSGVCRLTSPYDWRQWSACVTAEKLIQLTSGWPVISFSSLWPHYLDDTICSCLTGSARQSCHKVAGIKLIRYFTYHSLPSVHCNKHFWVHF